MSSICVVTSGPPNWHELLRTTVESKARYCRRWGYDLRPDMSNLVDKETGKPLRGFIKFDLMLRELVSDAYEWVVWIDGDALITNPDIRIEDVLANTPHKCLRCKHDCQGVSTHDFVTGYDHNSHHTTVIFARNTQQVKEYLLAANTVGRRLFIDHGWHEMEALRYFAQLPPYHDLIGWVSIKEICGILIEEYRRYGVPEWVAQQYRWEPGDWILHLSALPYERRTQLATFYSNPANHHLKPPKAFTPEQIAWLNAKRAEIGEEALRPIVAELEGRA